MAPANAAGPAEPDLTPPAVADAAELRRRIEAGEWVVDLRNRTAFAAGHVPGTLNFGLDGGFATYLGWLIPWGTPVTLLGATAEDVAEAQRELVRIGIDRPAAHAAGGPQDWTDGEPSTFPTATFADLAQVRHHREVVVLDVRRERGARRRPHRRRGQHPAPRAARTGSTRSRAGRCGCTAPAATARRSPPRCSTPPGAPSSPSTTPSTTPSRSGLHLVGPERVTSLLLAVVAGALIGLSLGALGRRRLDPRRPGARLRARPVPGAGHDRVARRRRRDLPGRGRHRPTVPASVLLARGLAFGLGRDRWCGVGAKAPRTCPTRCCSRRSPCSCSSSRP